ncbi:hypothetical protein U9M48_037305 [Paspalum notatum var. saurae]|uniref:Uncharacterized protein n=1 Tax=Paspalum notatum var. saurae TaxID=547442 RepID=A0AAQ3XAH3_PASNO
MASSPCPCLTCILPVAKQPPRPRRQPSLPMLTPCPGEACTPIGARSPSLFRYTSPSGGSFILMCSTPTKRRERYFHNPG